MSLRALLLSTDPVTLTVLGQVLAEIDAQVDDCRDFAAAAAKIESTRYEVVVVDAPDPQIAKDLLVKLRRSAGARNALAICVVDVQSSVRATFASGANLVLYRPVVRERARASILAAAPLVRREKRRHARSPVHAETSISYPSVESAAATLVDLSEEGLSLQCERQLPAKSRIYFRFTLPGQTKWIQLSGETVWQDSTGRAGIRFIDVPQSARRLLRDWLNTRSSVQKPKVTVDLPGGLPGPLPNSPDDRRVQLRHACQLGAEIYRAGSTVPHHCVLSDISVGGCYVEMPSPFETGANVQILVRTHNFKFRSAGVVQVVNRGFGMGVEFATQSVQQREQVQQLIKMVFQAREADADPVLRF